MKVEKVYWTIAQVAEIINVNASTLRFWESEFDWLNPKRNRKGERKYKISDIEAIKSIARRIKFLGMTLDGVWLAYKNGYNEDFEKIIDKWLSLSLEGKLITKANEKSNYVSENEHNE